MADEHECPLCGLLYGSTTAVRECMAMHTDEDREARR